MARKDRSHHIHLLVTKFKNRHLKQINGDTFEVPFITSDETHTLRIFLDKNFPKSKPVLHLDDSFEHPWLDTQTKRVIRGCVLYG